MEKKLKSLRLYAFSDDLLQKCGINEKWHHSVNIPMQIL